MTANEVRESFKKFFEGKGHKIVPSAPMVIKDDPTLMFTNAGMNQWKDIILGTKDPGKDVRRVDTQKCLRVSGKHNDLEEVGHDTYHHTMFEMLGNWSFGDYFKEGAIDMAWEYLTEVLKLNPADLYVTVFEGSKEEGLERDNEAAGYWAKHVPADHIINGNKHDNFWEMGETGPCGPCSEIHVDSRTPEEKAQVPGRELVNKDNPQVIEIWNIVFMQYNRKADGSLEPLPMHVLIQVWASSAWFACCRTSTLTMILISSSQSSRKLRQSLARSMASLLLQVRMVRVRMSRRRLTSLCVSAPTTSVP